ncbi:response regulator transcription factor [Enterococcus sp. BWR-S5]|uniref:response regulator transcription factor n=1 Tax=Enterococcus sp. BWR-S5 TaxID=2787714 RepID=UPI0019241E12|nr:response regulator transcription factor [Enterococcus sp. BWR-S5]MBL1226117.1 response regulator transcription factor [Enterococcus sp. BWR-S5]
MKTILIVEDEVKINKLIFSSLTAVGYSCLQAYYGMEALAVLQKETVDLIILDIQLPDTDGFSLIKSMKDIPVIYLTARSAIEDRIHGLNSGAEDYIVKPFALDELIARVQVVLRRFDSEEEVFKWRNLTVNFEKYTVKLNGGTIDLKPQEFSLLEVFIRHKNMALTREQLLQLAWGFDYSGDVRTVDVHVQRLRKKLQLDEQLKTVFKLGYRLEVE